MVCAGVQGQPSPDRGFRAAAAVGLRITRVLEVIPREGKPALMHVYVMRKCDYGWGLRGVAGVNTAEGGHREDQGLSRGAEEGCCRKEQFLVRLKGGELAPDMVEARRFMGLPP